LLGTTLEGHVAADADLRSADTRRSKKFDSSRTSCSSSCPTIRPWPIPSPGTDFELLCGPIHGRRRSARCRGVLLDRHAPFSRARESAAGRDFQFGRLSAPYEVKHQARGADKGPMGSRDRDPEFRALMASCRKLMGAVLGLWTGPASADVRENARRSTRHVERALRALSTISDGTRGLARSVAGRLLVDEGDQPGQPAQGRPPSREGFQGHSWSLSVSSVLGLLQIQSKTGVLSVNIGSEVISVIVDKGDIIHAWSDNSPPGTRLGDILVANGFIDANELEEFVVDHSASPTKLGDALESEGFITHSQLRSALEEQIQHLFDRLLAAPNAYFRFCDGHSETPEVRFNVMHLLLESCRARDEDGDETIRSQT
jgi:hypothetical protein